METKERHGCVTAWLILMIIANSITALMYLLAGDLINENFPEEIPGTLMIALAILAIGNVIFAVMLFNWRKMGFWGFVVTSVFAFIINLLVGISVIQSLFGLLGLGILYAVLQFKKADVTAWENLD